MSSTTASRRRITAFFSALAMIVSGAAATLATSPVPAGATPTEGCDVPFPVAELADGDLVTGLTVSSGTTPEPFSGEILGVLENGIAPGLDMVIARLESPALEAAGGIWQGMSGSPVYADDGRLIGAVAYGLAWGSSPVAGITPFADMERYLDTTTAPANIRIDDATARKIADETSVTKRQAGQGFAQLPMPRGVSGVRPPRLELTRRTRNGKRAYLPSGTYALGSASGESAAGIDTVVAGGNIAAVLSVGDVAEAGVGTATSVCGDRVVGFGHPMAFTGRTSLGLGAADAIYVQEDPLGVPFKVANLGEVGGTITDDRLAGIAGTFGQALTTVRFRSEVRYQGRDRVGDTDLFVADWLADIAFFGNIANHDRVIDAIQGGSETQSWRITGTDARGSQFTLRYTDRYRSGQAVVMPAAFHLPDLLWTLSTFPGVTVTSVTNRADVSPDTRKYRISRVHQKLRGRWVNRTWSTAKVKAGKRLKLRVRLVATDGSARNVRYQVKVPKRFAGHTGAVRLAGGDSSWDNFLFTSPDLETMRYDLRQRLRNDQVRLQLRVGRGPRKLDRVRDSAPLPLVVSGRTAMRVRVR